MFTLYYLIFDLFPVSYIKEMKEEMIDVLCCRVEQVKKCTEREQYIVMCKSI